MQRSFQSSTTDKVNVWAPEAMLKQNFLDDWHHPAPSASMASTSKAVPDLSEGQASRRPALSSESPEVIDVGFISERQAGKHHAPPPSESPEIVNFKNLDVLEPPKNQMKFTKEIDLLGKEVIDLTGEDSN
jgi:hypothetical protein